MLRSWFAIWFANGSLANACFGEQSETSSKSVSNRQLLTQSSRMVGALRYAAQVKKPRSVHQTQWAAQFAVASELCKRGYQVARLGEEGWPAGALRLLYSGHRTRSFFSLG